MIDLTPILQAVVTLCAAVITCWLVPLLRSRMSQSRFERLTAVVETLVYAADKLYRTGVIDSKTDYVRFGLESRGYTYDRAAVEAAVKQLDLMELLNEAEEDGDGDAGEGRDHT